jgi:hypothetical protein
VSGGRKWFWSQYTSTRKPVICWSFGFLMSTSGSSNLHSKHIRITGKVSNPSNRGSSDIFTACDCFSIKVLRGLEYYALFTHETCFGHGRNLWAPR